MSSRARRVRAVLSWFQRFERQGEWSRFSAMFMISVEWQDEAKTRARFSLPGREEWRTEHLDALMQVLAQIREEMSPAVAEEPPRLQEVQALHDPRYSTELHQFSGGTVLSFRHPSLGWLPFLLPSLERRKIVSVFESQEAAWREIGRRDAAPRPGLRRRSALPAGRELLGRLAHAPQSRAGADVPLGSAAAG